MKRERAYRLPSPATEKDIVTGNAGDGGGQIFIISLFISFSHCLAVNHLSSQALGRERKRWREKMKRSPTNAQEKVKEKNSALVGSRQKEDGKMKAYDGW